MDVNLNDRDNILPHRFFNHLSASGTAGFPGDYFCRELE